MTMMPRLSVTVPLAGVPLPDHQRIVEQLASAGFDGLAAGEVDGLDGTTPLAYLAAANPGMGLICGLLNVFTRGPALLAMTAAALGEMAPGRANLAIGAGSPTIVESWNDIEFAAPARRAEHVLGFLRRALDGERLSIENESFTVRGFRLRRPPREPVRLLIGGLGPRMQQIAARDADGLMLNLVAPSDVARIRQRLNNVERHREEPLEIVAGISVTMSTDTHDAEMAARRHLAAYLSVPGYRRFQQRCGRGEQLASMWEAWESGDRHRAVRELPESVLEDLAVFGTPEHCATSIRRYFEHGLDSAVLALLPPPEGSISGQAQANFLAEIADEL